MSRGDPRRGGRRALPREHRMPVLHGILAFVLILVIVQLWLLNATMEAYLGGEHGLLLPAGLASAVCFGLNAGLLWYVRRMEAP